MGKETEQARRFADQLAQVYGDDVVAVALYGSAARGEYREGLSDLNMLVVLERLDAAALHRGTPLAREWTEQGNPPPLMMSRAEWHGSADVFAIEYADIRDAHTVLMGPDIFQDIEIRWKHLRLQTERELKEKKIQIRERYLLAADVSAELGALLIKSFPTFLTLFRAALRLARVDPPNDAAAVIALAAEKMEFDPEPWMTVHAARSAPSAFEPGAEDPVLVGYLEGVARASEWVDGLPPEDSAVVD